MDQSNWNHTTKEKAQQLLPRQMELLKQFAAIDCGTGNLAGNAQVVELVCQVLKEIGAKVEITECPKTGKHVIGRLNAGSKHGKIIFNAHLDTVFHPGDTQKYPFHVEGDWAHGLGVADCKGGVAVSLFAALGAKELGLLPDCEVVFLYNADEEIGSPTGRKLFEQESKGADYAFVFEPARENNGIITLRKGVAFIKLAVTGKEAHAGLKYADGRSANVELASKILELYNKNDDVHELYYNIGTMQGGTSTAIVPGAAKADCCVSLKDDQALQTAKAHVASLADHAFLEGTTTTAEMDVLFPPMERTEKNLQAYDLVHRAGLQMGCDFPECHSSGSSDACYFSSLGVSTVDAMGPFMNDIHTPSERMYIPGLLERTQLTMLVLANLQREG